ncbi:hypothetical protein VP275E431_P0078 [Vibrio phage 275E43-1]|nr:hypothetical protein VP275E431_P0078 [Vibrio phage 275E43-1]
MCPTYTNSVYVQRCTLVCINKVYNMVTVRCVSLRYTYE